MNTICEGWHKKLARGCNEIRLEIVIGCFLHLGSPLFMALFVWFLRSHFATALEAYGLSYNNGFMIVNAVDLIYIMHLYNYAELRPRIY